MYISCIMIRFHPRHYILVILFCLLNASPFFYPQSINFNNLTVENGLSNNDVNTLLQDRTGFIWFGTEDGLNRYDGYNFKVFRHESDDSNSISDNSIWALFEDRQGNIWIGTKSGVLNKYDPLTEEFTHWRIKSNLTEENSINAIYEDRDGNIWIGTYKGGLYKLDLTTNKINNWNANSEDNKSLSHNYVLAIIEDHNGNIIIGTYIGLNKFNPDVPENGFERFYYNPDDKNSLSSNLIWSLTRSAFDKNIIWICTSNHLTKFNSERLTFEKIEIANPDNLQYGTSTNSIVEENVSGEKIIWLASYSGLIGMNLTIGSYKRFTNDENNLQSISDNRINKIIKDRTGVLWAATESGVSYSTPKSTLFNSIDFRSGDFNTVSVLKKKGITAIAQTDDKRIWIGTTDGLYKLNHLKINPVLSKIPEFDGYHIWSLAAANNNELWIGTFGKGLKKFIDSENKIVNWDLKNPKIKTGSVYYNKAVLADRKNNIWVGYWGVGAARITPQTGISNVWLNEPGNPKSISHNDVWAIKEDRLGRIWIGTQGGGLNLFEDSNGGIFHHWQHTENEKSGLSSNNINTIYEASSSDNTTNLKATLWIGTSNGLNRVDVKQKSISDPYDISLTFHSYTIIDGLSANNVNSILEDDEGNLWLGTGDGISLFDVHNKTFTNFSSEDGLNGTMMNPESGLKLDNGLMLFGSTKGLNIFDPGKIKLSDYKPSIVFTDFQIFNRSVRIGENSPLKESILNSKEIILSHDQNVFSFEFAALDYNSPQSIQYAYKMEGFDNHWIESGKRRYVTYTNLNPGEYILKVKSTNADGVWNNEGTSLSIIISPPWWQTPWAYIAYFILIAFGLLAIRRFELNRTKLRNELKLREFEVRKKTELEELKSRFFANLSHEFRTPLMLIKGPVEQIKSGKNDKNFSENINLIEKNSNRLKDLIDQLLELSQLEKASIPLKAKKENLVTLLKGLVSSFESLAEQKNISLKIESDSEDKVCWVDRDKFEKVINNLLSNAFKFTPNSGSVSISVKESLANGKQFAEIIITDSGVGIPEDKINKIFDRFFQVDDSTQRSYGGSGIGLALVKEFVDLHKWEISVKSESGEGTEFIIKIPMWDDYLRENEKVKSKSEIDLGVSISNKYQDEQLINPISVPKNKSDLITSNNKPSILIVDDSEDVRKYLSSLLEDDYNVSLAENGEEGIKVASDTNPDLILSDVMMPSMDGMEFCSKIKSNWMTSDIPVILLTAKASIESKLEGLEIGADDYLTKPFNSRELFTRIKNLLEQRKRLRDKYNKSLDLLTGTSKLNKADTEFINKALEFLEKNIDKTNFGTEQLAKELFVSRTQLHRKMLTISGQAPGEFIRIFKLKRASQLLLEGKFSVTQVAYEIGFSSPAQFTRAFTKQFNCLPSEFPSRHKSFS